MAERLKKQLVPIIFLLESARIVERSFVVTVDRHALNAGLPNRLSVGKCMLSVGFDNPLLFVLYMNFLA